MNKSIISAIFNHADKHPDKLALIAKDQLISYQRLKEKIFFCYAAMKSSGVKPSDKVILAATQSPSFVFGYFAAHLLGAVAVPIDPNISKNNLEYIVEQTNPAKIFLSKCVISGAIPIDELDAADLNLHDVNTGDSIATDDVADVLFTTGTTSRPKGVVLTHRNIYSAAHHINSFIGNSSQDREIVPLPLSHSFGLGRLRCNMLAGGTLIICDSIVQLKKIFSDMNAWKATGFCSVPAGFALMLKLSGDKLGEYSAQLKYIEIGSAPMPMETKKKLMELLPKTRICMHYGLTEASRSCFIEFNSENDKLASVGRPSPNVDVRICDGNHNVIPNGCVGNIHVKGPHVMKEYLNNPELTERAFYGDWLDTGDVGVVDDDSYVYLKGRQNEIINVGGLKVRPDEVEEFLKDIDIVKDCACVGIPDPRGISGECVKAFLVLKENNSLDQSKAAIAKYLRSKIEEYKIPSVFEVIDKIPRTSSGKIQRQMLKK